MIRRKSVGFLTVCIGRKWVLKIGFYILGIEFLSLDMIQIDFCWQKCWNLRMKNVIKGKRFKKWVKHSVVNVLNCGQVYFFNWLKISKALRYIGTFGKKLGLKSWPQKEPNATLCEGYFSVDFFVDHSTIGTWMRLTPKDPFLDTHTNFFNRNPIQYC